MKPVFTSPTFVSAKRLPLTLAAACLGVGAIGLAVTLHQPVDLSPFTPTTAPRLAAAKTIPPLITPEPFNLVLGDGVVDEVPTTPEATADIRVVAAPRTAAPVFRQAVPVATAIPEPEPDPSVSAAGSGTPEALPTADPNFDPRSTKDTAGSPPEPYFLPNQGMGKGDDGGSAAAPPPLIPNGIVAGALPELSEYEPNPDIPLPQASKDQAR